MEIILSEIHSNWKRISNLKATETFVPAKFFLYVVMAIKMIEWQKDVIDLCYKCCTAYLYYVEIGRWLQYKNQDHFKCTTIKLKKMNVIYQTYQLS